MRSTLGALPDVLPASDDPAAALESLSLLVERLYSRSVLTPKSNIGTLLMAFVTWFFILCAMRPGHHAGHRAPDAGTAVALPHDRSGRPRGGGGLTHHAASSVQQASNLENLLHPQLSSRRPQMLVYLDPAKVDVGSCHAVMSHLRGRLLATTCVSYLRAAPVPLVNLSLDDLPPALRVRLRRTTDSQRSINGLRLPIDTDALVWHNISVATPHAGSGVAERATRRATRPRPEADRRRRRRSCAALVRRRWVPGAVGSLRRVPAVDATRPCHHGPLVPTSTAAAPRTEIHNNPVCRQTMIDQTWPCVADIFCAAAGLARFFFCLA